MNIVRYASHGRNLCYFYKHSPDELPDDFMNEVPDDFTSY